MIKRVVILLIILIHFSSLFSQTGFAPLGAEWYYYMYGGFSPFLGNNHFTVTKDTSYLGKDCRKITVEEFNYDGEKDDEFNFYIYEDTGKVYISYHNQYELLFEFNLEVGDTLKSIIPYEYIGLDYTDSLSYTSLILDSTEIIDVSGHMLKRFYFTHLEIYTYIYFTERIGGNNYFFPYDYELLGDIVDPVFICYHDSEINLTLQQCDSTNNSWLPIENNEYRDFTIKPIPHFGVEISLDNHMENEISGILLFNLSGILLKYLPVNTTDLKCLIKMDSYPEGVYFITLITKNKPFSKKIFWMKQGN